MRAHQSRHVLVAMALMAFTVRPGEARAQFPIVESFTHTSQTGWTLQGSATLTAGHGDTDGNGWLRLTDATTNKAGTAYYNTAFPSTDGIVVTFDYADYGGTNADGFSVFLIDGTTATPTVGSSGGPLGYAAKVDSTPSPPNSCATGPQVVKATTGTGTTSDPYVSYQGVTAGYVGVGFDEFGNFSACESGYNSPGKTPQSIVIRGSGSSGSGSQTGFRYLAGVTPGFTIDQVLRTAPRRARISIINKVITVEMDLTGTGASYQTIVPGYNLAAAPGQVAMPATFKLGISGSTGGNTNVHEIRNVRVEKPVHLSLQQASSPAAAILVGETLTYTITVANDATNDATGTSITDHFPAGLTGVRWTCTGTGGASLPAMSGTGDLVATGTGSATLPRSSSLTCTVTGTVAAAALGTTLTNVVNVAPPSGSANLLSSTANTAVVVAYPTRTTLGSSVPTTVYGQPTTLTATTVVTAGSATPAGTITFYDGATALGPPVALDAAGQATLTVKDLAPGDHALGAHFAGTTRFWASDATAAAQRVNPASTVTSIGTSLTPALLGQPVMFTVRVDPASPGGFVPDGVVTLLDGGVPVATATLDGAGQATFTSSALALGDHAFTAAYGGSDRYLASATLAPLTQAVIPASTTTQLVVGPNPGVFGVPVTLSATVVPVPPAGGVATGQVAFLEDGALLATVDLGGGEAQLARAPAAGVHTYSAVYLGVTGYAGSTSLPFVEGVSAAPTVTTLAASANPAVTGEPIVWTVRVATSAGAGTPGGTVQLTLDGAPLTTLTLAGGEATFSPGALAVAAHAVGATYGGDADHAASAASLSQRVNAAATDLTLEASRSAVAYGEAVTFSVTVAARSPGAGTPTGTISFTDNGAPLGTRTLSGGKASFTAGALRAGGHAVVASYGGDEGFSGATASIAETVDAAATATALEASPAPSVFGEPVTLTARVTTAPGAGTPTGPVTFRDGALVLGTADLDAAGVARLPGVALPAGARTLTATYGADVDHAGSTSPALVQGVAPAATAVAVASSLPTSTFGDEVVLSAAVSVVQPGAGTPTGAVTFLVDGAPIGTGTLAGGVATLRTAGLPAGALRVTASYPGDGSFTAGEGGDLTQLVSRAALQVTVAASANPTAGEPVTLTATVTGPGAPGGTVTFRDGDTVLCDHVAVEAGVARCTTALPTGGGHAIVADASGDGDHAASTGTLNVTVSRAPSAATLTAAPEAAAFGQPVTLTATVAPAGTGAGLATGSVEFREGETLLGTVALDGAGTARLTVSSAALGVHAVTAAYRGDDRYLAATSPAASFAVGLAATTTALAAGKNPVVYGEPVALAVQVAVPPPGAGTPAGPVTVEEGGAVLGAGTLQDGAATVTLSGLEPGAHALVARFGGGDPLAPSTSAALSLRVNPAGARVSLSATPSPAPHGAEVTLTATVAAVAPGGGVPAGDVLFSDGAAALGQAALDGAGRAVLTTRSLAPGAHALTAAYAGSARHLAATSGAAPLEVEREAVTLTVTSSRNPGRRNRPVTFTVTAAAAGGTPDGTVTLRDGDAVLAELTLSGGAASFTTRELLRGRHPVTAAYAGTEAFAAATATVDEEIENSPPVAGAGTALEFWSGGARAARLAAPVAEDPARGTVELWLWASETQPVDPAPVLRLGAQDAPRLGLALSSDRRTLAVTLGVIRTDLPVALDDGGWHHLAVSSDGKATTVLLDAVPVGSLDAGLWAGDAGALTLGEQFSGGVDELRIWSSARTAGELDAVRYRVLKGTEDGLQALWRFDEGSGAELFDAGPAHLDGTLDLDLGAQGFTRSGAWAHQAVSADHALLVDAGYDPDGDPLTVTIGEAPALGTLRRDDGLRLRYDAPEAGTGQAALAWTLDDGAATAAGSMEVEVSGAIACASASACPSGELCVTGQCTMPEKLVARSGAGCGAGPAGPGAALALLGLLAVWLARPGRRRALRALAPARSGLARAIGRGAPLLALLAWAAGARAQTPQGFALQTLEPAPAGDRFFSLPEATTAGKLRPALALTGAYTDRPLVLKRGGHELPGGHLVDQAVWVWAQGALAVADRVVVDAALPVALAQDGAKPIGDLARVSGTALGDVRLGARAELPVPLPASLHAAAGLDVWLPTGRRGAFSSDGTARALPRLLASGEAGPIAFAAELGVLVRRDADLGVLTRTGSAFHYAAAVAYRYGDLQVGPELFGRKQFRGAATSPAEALLGVRWRLAPFTVGAAAGTALNDAPGAAPLRVVATVAWRPEEAR